MKIQTLEAGQKSKLNALSPNISNKKINRNHLLFTHSAERSRADETHTYTDRRPDPDLLHRPRLRRKSKHPQISPRLLQLRIPDEAKQPRLHRNTR